MSLTDVAVRNAKGVTGKTVKLSDGQGLQLWVHPTGTKTWNLAYRVDGRQKKLNLGKYPAISLKDARARRDEAKREIELGRDPSQQKQAAKLASKVEASSTFAAVADEWLAKRGREGKAEATMSKLGWLIDLARPTLGPKPIGSINSSEVLEALRTVEARGRLETARRMRSVLSQVFCYAAATGRAESDPTVVLRGALTAPTVKHRAAIVEPKPFGELLRAIEGHEGMPEVRLALRLLALTFVRPGELRTAKWSEFDWQNAVWVLPKEKTKMRRPHRVPLARQAMECLDELRRLSGNYEFLFPSARSHTQPISENTLNVALRRLGYKKDEMTAHGFRSAASSMLNESGLWNPDAVEAQLAHVEANSVRRAYQRAEFWDERVRMMNWWGDRLDQLRTNLNNS
jgi:integrase